MMATLLRYAGIAIVVLVFAIVLTVCGEGACLSCAHACCVKPDRVDRLRTGLDRLLAACAVCRVHAGAVTERFDPGLLRSRRTIGFSSLLAEAGSPLRT